MVKVNDLLPARILVVDDQPANITLLEQLLHNAGYTRVTSTTRPDEVCALHRTHDFDAILLDLQMPGMDGFQVIEALKAITSDAYLPVLVVSAQPEHRQRALQVGARDFIGTPFDMLEVETRIRHMLEMRLLYKKLQLYAEHLEATVQQRTAELLESEARYRSLTELASDWYWEQDEEGNFTKVSGPVLEMLGIRVGTPADDPQNTQACDPNHALTRDAAHAQDDGWNKAQREHLRACIAARKPFLDFVFSRVNADGSTQQFRVSGEPMFDQCCRYIGYRGVGVEISS